MDLSEDSVARIRQQILLRIFELDDKAVDAMRTGEIAADRGVELLTELTEFRARLLGVAEAKQLRVTQ